jgi:transcriptional regulator with XRE-family HTH domain
MLTETVQGNGRKSKKVTARERDAYRRAFRVRGWTQNEAARRIGKAGGLFSRWLSGEIASSIIRERIDQALAETEANGG